MALMLKFQVHFLKFQHKRRLMGKMGKMGRGEDNILFIFLDMRIPDGIIG